VIIYQHQQENPTTSPLSYKRGKRIDAGTQTVLQNWEKDNGDLPNAGLDDYQKEDGQSNNDSPRNDVVSRSSSRTFIMTSPDPLFVPVYSSPRRERARLQNLAAQRRSPPLNQDSHDEQDDNRTVRSEAPPPYEIPSSPPENPTLTCVICNTEIHERAWYAPWCEHAAHKDCMIKRSKLCLRARNPLEEEPIYLCADSCGQQSALIRYFNGSSFLFNGQVYLNYAYHYLADHNELVPYQIFVHEEFFDNYPTNKQYPLAGLPPTSDAAIYPARRMRQRDDGSLEFSSDTGNSSSSDDDVENRPPGGDLDRSRPFGGNAPGDDESNFIIYEDLTPNDASLMTGGLTMQASTELNTAQAAGEGGLGGVGNITTIATDGNSSVTGTSSHMYTPSESDVPHSDAPSGDVPEADLLLGTGSFFTENPVIGIPVVDEEASGPDMSLGALVQEVGVTTPAGRIDEAGHVHRYLYVHRHEFLGLNMPNEDGTIPDRTPEGVYALRQEFYVRRLEHNVLQAHRDGLLEPQHGHVARAIARHMGTHESDLPNHDWIAAWWVLCEQFFTEPSLDDVERTVNILTRLMQDGRRMPTHSEWCRLEVELGQGWEHGVAEINRFVRESWRETGVGWRFVL
jgi:hypothetical protein